MSVQANGAGPLPEVPKMSAAAKDELASKIQSDFAQVMGTADEDDAPAAETAEAPDETAAPDADAVAGDEAPAKSDDAAQDEAAPETTEQPTEAAAQSSKSTAPTLPAAYVRSLKAYDWTDEEIKEAAQQPGFLATAAKIHANRNRELQTWADAGRRAKEAQASQQPAKDAAQSDPQASGLKPIDAAALKAEYGDDVLIDKLVGPLNATIAQINAILPVVQQTQQRAAMSQAEMLARQIDGFFGSKDLEPYHKQYGTNTATLDSEQLAARQKVLEFADYLVGGAAQNGRSLSFDEAMQMAHDAVSGGTKEQAARQKIVAQTKQRNKGISMKPGARGTNLNGAGSPAKTRSDLEKRVNQGLRAVLG
jgi:hypothetical protein